MIQILQVYFRSCSLLNKLWKYVVKGFTQSSLNKYALYDNYLIDLNRIYNLDG